ncbi:UDP-N-acetylmuramoyl-L-alanyl-D-glutamate--2,6-diaminopimelate ligase [Geopsychrobacter electrodiphilus]|uniref:UDP-N-acetylmuramoyl-L-alanyl-D-glutamate--2, 6-diaminopimelate ligase n=1 Tax=Geopsychrobacter electrodiphilus TaxID=225196 RepID=UPI001FDF280F|nr:UDP-N-acetylmuramoyl-L-alanyl-D-glutamate--2,6-diaminopimelate ligase [Geopsychrobacter electrodiphilus]
MKQRAQLRALIAEIPGLLVTGGTTEVAGLACDSRRVVPGDLFFALPGVKCDGWDYIAEALAAGACALVLNRAPQTEYGVPVVVAENIRLAMAQIAQRFYADPSSDLLVIGVTGTNGKTTTSYLLESILKAAGYRPAVFGTVDYRFGSEKIPASHTTPESIELLKLVAEFRGKGANALILEVSSHALEQHRVDGLKFNVAIFTNLTPEHLDFHGTMDAYFSSKARLFDLVPAHSGVINLDDSYGVWLKDQHPDALGFSRLLPTDIGLKQLSSDANGQRGEMLIAGNAVALNSALVGDFNVSNILAAVAGAHCAGVTDEAIALGIAQAPQVPGRLERVENRRGVLALVDFAHTSDALTQVLAALVGIPARRRITVVGCGGDRDPKKRPLMAAAAVRSSDLAVLTSDNPRTEDPLAILEQMKLGAVEAGCELTFAEAVAGESGFVVIPDRRAALDFAASLAAEGDLLLVAGKGHEDYQVLGTTKIHFDDREELTRALNCATHTKGGHQ